MNRLEHLKQFEKILANYHVTPDSQQILHQTKLVLLLGPTSGGRNTIIWELVKTGDYHFIVSDTTRQPRVNDGIPERDGVEYWFRTEAQVLDDLKQGKFLEAEVIHGQQVSGISIRELKSASDQDKIAINEVDLLGIHNIVSAKPDTIAILVLPPSFEEWQRRIMGRGVMSGEEYKRRLETACKIFKAGLEQDYFKFVVNDTIAHAVEQVDLIAKTGNSDAGMQKLGHELAEELLRDTIAHLDKLQ